MTMTTDTPPPTKSRAGAGQLARAQASRQRTAAMKAQAFLVKRLRYLEPEEFADLCAAVEFEQMIRAQGTTTDDDVEGETE